MVAGLERFREWFAPHANQFALIGGTACELLLYQLGRNFRATRDLDIVVLANPASDTFAQAVWDFVRAGGYTAWSTARGRRVAYRFERPADTGFPAMLEFFASGHGNLGEPAPGDPVPVVVDDLSISSFSAILLDEEYARFLSTGVAVLAELPVVRAEYLVPSKARAFLDLSARRERGEPVDTTTIKKHRNDIVRLYPILDPAAVKTPASVRQDMARFLDQLDIADQTLRQLSGLHSISLETMVSGLRNIYVKID